MIAEAQPAEGESALEGRVHGAAGTAAVPQREVVG